jgi:lactate dehydrogenase-like 2-hydroxyacid dehydrogenase
MHTRYKKNYPFLLAAAPHLVDSIQDCAMWVALDHIRRLSDKSRSTHVPSAERESLPPSRESS